MAFCNKLSGLLRQGVPQSNVPFMLNSIRMMSSRLFVGGLSWVTDDRNLNEAFSSFGELTEVRVITDRETGRSRGFGFVGFADSKAANAAVAAMDGQELDGRNIRVSIAAERPSGPKFGGGGDTSGNGGFGGGYGV